MKVINANPGFAIYFEPKANEVKLGIGILEAIAQRDGGKETWRIVHALRKKYQNLLFEAAPTTEEVN